MVEMERIELSIPACKTGVFPLALHPQDLARPAGIEPTSDALEERCLIHMTTAGRLERGAGIEPATLAWKARVIPFYEPRDDLGAGSRGRTDDLHVGNVSFCH